MLIRAKLVISKRNSLYFPRRILYLVVTVNLRYVPSIEKSFNDPIDGKDGKQNEIESIFRSNK